MKIKTGEIAENKDKNVVSSVQLAKGTRNGTLKLIVNGQIQDNVAIKGTGSSGTVIGGGDTAALWEAINRKVDISFFDSLFTVYDNTNLKITTNTYTQTPDNLEISVGTWTEEYLSALGKNSEDGGGGGGTGTVTGIAVGMGSDPIYPDYETGIVTIPAYPTRVSQLINDSSYITNSYLSNNYYTRTDADSKFMTIAAFERVFNILDENGIKINHPYSSGIDSIKALKGLWTEQYLSALGQNSEGGGGGGGTGTVTSIQVAPNTYRDPDSNGIIDLSNDVVSSTDRTRWDSAATSSHTHSNKSVLDTITSAQVTSWNNVASIIGEDSDIVINKWNEVVAFLATYTEADTLANLLSNKLDVQFFSSIFTVYDSNGNAIVPNTYTQVVDNLKIMVGAWTEQYLSALGKNSEEGGGGTGDVSHIKISSNPDVYLDPVDGIIDMSSYATTWNAKANSATTLAGYGIGDAKISNGVITLGSSTITPVTSVGLSAPTGFSVSGSPVTKTGTLTFAYASGYEGFTTSLKEKIEALYSWFEVDANGDVKTKDTAGGHVRGFYTESFVSALGKNSQGGSSTFDEEQMWEALGTDTTTKVIDTSHIPDMASTYGYLKASALNGYATQAWVNSQGFVTSSGVTSVAMTVPTGLSVSGTPITTTGTLALTFASGYSIPTTAKQGNWDTAYGWGNHATAGYAMGTTKIIAGNGLTGGGTLAADRTLSIQLQSNSGLTVSSSGLKLDIINNLTTESAYKAISATQAKKIWDLLNQMFTLEGAGTTASPYVIKANYGLYTEQFLSALGQNSSGGGSGDFDEAQMWVALQSTSGTYGSEKIATTHIPDMASTYGYLKSSALSGYATQAWVNQQGFLTTHQTLYTLSIYGGTTKVLDFKPNANASIYIKAGGDISLTNDTTNKYITLSYTHPTNGANTTISAASGKVLSAITVNSLGHVTSVSSKTLAAADIPDISATYATASRATTLEGYFTNGVAKEAAKLSTVSKKAWGQTYWTSGGVPQDVDGTLTISGGELQIWNTADTSAENRWDMRFGWTREIFQMWAYEGAYHDLAIGNTAAATATYKGLYYDASEKMWGIGTTTPAYTFDVKGSLATTGAITLAGTSASTRRIYFGDTSHYLELNSTGFHFSHGVYSDSFVSALGANSSGGGSGTFDEEAMWTALGTTSTAKVIASSHIPNLSAAKITSGTLAAARIPIATASAVGGIKVGTTLAISDGVLNQKSGIATAGTYRSVTVDTYGRVTAGTNPTTLSGYGVLDDANDRYFALYGGTNLSPSSSNAVDLNTITDTGSYYVSNSTTAQYVSNRPVTGSHDFRLWVIATIGTSANYKRQRYARYDNNNVYERYTTNGGTSWSTWELVQANLSNYASASSLDDYLPLSGGTVTGNLVVNGTTTLDDLLTTNTYITVDRSPYGAISLGDQLNVLRARCKNAESGTFAYNAVISLFGSGETGTTVNNLGVRLGSQSGATWISAGESGKTLSSQYTDMCNTESVYITADNQIKFFTNCSNDGTSFTDAATINSSGDLTVARYVYATSFHGDLSGNSASTTALKNLYNQSTRPTSANLTHITNGGVQHFKATSSMTEGKPSGDGHILHFHWDGTAYDAQLSISTGTPPWMQLRSSHPTNGWSDWITVLTSNNYNNYAPSLTGTGASGTWGISVTGNAATATTLATARNIWGQSFNGSAAVKGNLYMISSEDDVNVNSPSAKLKFNSYDADGTNVRRSPYIQALGGSSYGRKRLGFFQSNAANYTDDFVEVLSILPTGNIGIGTTSPSQKLDVDGNIIASGYVAVGTGGSNSALKSNTTNNIYLENSEGIPLVCQGLVVRRGASATTATLGNSDYRWGGLWSTTGNFSSTLSVTGASTLTGNITAGGDIYLSNAKYIRANNSSGTAEQLMGMNASNQLLIGYGHRTSGQTILYGLSLALSTNGSTRVTITNAGNVGIANSSPSEKLHVTGNILASGEVTASSDERLKTIVGDGNLDLRYIANAPNILFKWNNGQDDKVHGGSLAQYFLHGAKHFVLGSDKDYYSLNYGALATSMAISIAKEVLKHEDEITRLKKEVVKQAEEIVDLKNKVSELEERRA